MFSPKISLDKSLHKRAEARAAELGYSGLSEYVTHLLERELANDSDPEEKKAVAERLKGLGYL